jgi:myosin heavy subunit
MTTMAKVFVGLNLVLACAAFGAAAALLGAQDDYKSKLQVTVKEDKEAIDRLTQKVTEKNADIAHQRQQASEATAARTAAESAKNTLQGELNKATEVNTQLRSTNERYSSELKSLGELYNGFKSDLKTMQDKTSEMIALASEWQRKFQESESENARLTQTVNMQSEENTNLQAARADLDKSLKEAKFLLDAYAKKYGQIAPRRKLPDGMVLSIKATEVGTFVAISVGGKDGLRVGDEYHLSRGGEYVGRIKLIRISKDSAYGRADERWTGRAWPPRQNDKAWTE